MTPEQLAAELGITGKALRSWLRANFPRPDREKYSPWDIPPEAVRAARARWAEGGKESSKTVQAARKRGGRALSDEAYVVDLCDEILDEQALRQHRFDWLRGDQGHRLPVDAYYRRRRVVVEYRERQHEEPNPHFDKPHKLTVSGVHRGIQRKLYDHRRTELVPAHGLTLVVISPADLSANSRGRLRRDRTADKRLLSAKLGKHIGQS